jgi:2-keto-4-pentenoate hydratase/2-oxohepta-3-ene-1,7-dioic acid hydratase in catechol pathway
MRIVRFLDASQQEHFGVLQADGTALRITAAPWQDHAITTQRLSIAKLLAPVIPPAILCIGLNYRKHAEETGTKIPSHPVLFMKNPAAIQNPGDPIVLPRKLASTKVDYECELAIVIGQRCKNVARKDALKYVLGYTCANDVSARDWQKDFGGTQWCRGKTFDTFCPIGPAIVTPDEVGDPNQLQLSTDVSGERLQSSSTQDMIFDVPTLIEFLSGSTTLLPGTVILTGTPEGVGMGRTPNRYLKAGDHVTITIERIGSLTNPVIEET